MTGRAVPPPCAILILPAFDLFISSSRLCSPFFGQRHRLRDFSSLFAMADFVQRSPLSLRQKIFVHAYYNMDFVLWRKLPFDRLEFLFSFGVHFSERWNSSFFWNLSFSDFNFFSSGLVLRKLGILVSFGIAYEASWNSFFRLEFTFRKDGILFSSGICLLVI